MKIEFANLSTDAGLRGLNLAFELDRLTVLHDPWEEMSGPILSALAGQSQILEGTLSVDGVPLDRITWPKPLHKVFGYVFDEGIMLANLSLRENLMLPLRWQNPKLRDDEFDRLAAPWLELFELKLDLALRPAMVKAAPRKFLSYIRSLMLEPDYLLIDDPYYLLNKVERHIMLRALAFLRATHRMLIASSDDDFSEGFNANCIELEALYERR